jgi:predicted Zn-dependent protease
MRRYLLSLAGFAAIGALACTAARLATPGGETELGEDAAVVVERQIGLVQAPELSRYVKAIGARLVKDSAVRTDVDYHFEIVDMAEPNAFALPGGFVYVSRGLLALLNSEDELASVIGHEIGHVAAHHHLRHAMMETPLIPVRLAAGLGGFATGIVSPGLGKIVSGVGSAPGALTLATHSRAQEDEADEIGQKLVADAGWDPGAMATLMDALSREAQLEGRDPNRQSFLDTHPSTPSRSRQTLERASTLPVARIAPIVPDRRKFYGMLDGLLYGDPASHGVVVDGEFLHPDLDLRVAFPDAWKVENGRESVVAAPEAGDALAVFTIAAEGDDPAAVANEVVRKASLKVDGHIESTSIGGLPAARASAHSSEGWSNRYRHLVAWIQQGGVIYQIAGTTRESDWSRYQDSISRTVGSVRPLGPADRKRVREARLRVVDAKRGETLAALLERSGSAWSPERAAAANGIAANAALQSGQPVKVARWEPYAPAAPAKSSR